MIYHARNKAQPKDKSIFFSIITHLYILAVIPIICDFDTLIMSEEGNPVVHLSNATSVNTIQVWHLKFKELKMMHPYP